LQTGLDVACYVSNYGGPDQSPGNFTKAQAADKPSVKKTVAMEYSTIEHDPSGLRVVKFYIYDGACTDVIPGCAANSPRSPSANLDDAGEKFVPNLCVTCHGGGFYAPVNPSRPTFGEVTLGASFREFDVYSYRDGTAGPKPSDPAFGLSGVLAQEDAFYAQNQMVFATNPAQPIKDLIQLFYPTGGTPFDPNAIPCGWRANTAAAPCSGNFSGGTGNPATESLYHDVVAKACRTCHSAQLSVLAWDTYKKFADDHGALGTTPADSGYGIAGLVCTTGLMPHANTTYTNFWRSSSPHGPDTLKTFSQAAINADSPAWTAFGSCTPP
jgi:hypothetical protein